MGRPKKEEETGQLRIVLPVDDLKALEELAQEDSRSRNQMASKLIQDQLRDRKKKDED